MNRIYWITTCFCTLCILAILFFGASLLNEHGEKKDFSTKVQTKNSEEKLQQIQVPSSSLLSLKQDGRQFFEMALEEEVSYLNHESLTATFFFHQSQEIAPCKQGEQICIWQDGDDQMFIKVEEVADEHAEISLWLTREEKTRELLKKLLVKKELPASTLFPAIQDFTWLGYDLFYKEHGGLELESMARALKIQYPDGSVHYLHTGDSFTWQKGPKPCHIEVVQASDHKLSLFVQDEQKLIKKPFYLTKHVLLQSQMQVCVQSILPFHMRSSNKVFTYVGNQKFLLEPGDWFLLQNNTWKKLRSACDIEDYESEKNRGYLLVIDAIIREQKRFYLTGHIFSPSRTKCQRFKRLIDSKYSLPGA